ncbi:MAG: twin-arginine translocase TatA/TatE family subunit [Hyphomicrobiales bacterium]
MFGSIGPWQIIIVALLVVLLFGRGKISEMMGDVAKGINSFKKGLKEDPEKAIDHTTTETVSEETKDQTKAS